MKSSAFKKYSRKNLKAKLTAARDKYGKKTPLKFINGDFVRDFLAMKKTKNTPILTKALTR